MESREFDQVGLTFHSCTTVPDADSVVPLLRLLDQNGLHPMPVSKGMPADQPAGLKSTLLAGFLDLERELEESHGLLQRAACHIRAEGIPPAAIEHFYFYWITSREPDQTIAQDVILTGGVIQNTDEQDHHFPLLARKLYQIGKRLYPLLRPAYGFIALLDEEGHPPLEMFDVRNEIVTLSWVNFFGPAYVARYGRDLLMNIPGHHTEELEDGILYQSRANIKEANEIRRRKWREKAKQYLAAHGIEVRFDYHLLF